MHISNAISISGRFFGGYANRLLSAYVKRVTDDGGVVEAKECVKAAFIELGAAPVVFVGLLNTYSGAAAAYSLRQLSSIYSGNAIRVRRASDDTEQDIGFVNNELDTTSLASFCSGTDGFVTTWYDQSGNGYNATQTTAANQPQIVSSGSVIQDNGKPAVDFDGSNNYLSLSSLLTIVSGSFVYNFSAGGNNMIVTEIGNTNNHYIFHSPTQVSFDGGVATNDEARMSLNGGSLTSYAENQTGSYSINQQYHLYFNYDTGRSMNTSFDSIGFLLSTFDFSGKIQEIITWSADNSSNVNGINTNINDFYSIYP